MYHRVFARTIIVAALLGAVGCDDPAQPDVSPPTLATGGVQAVAADKFVNSLSVGTKLGYNRGIYSTAWSSIIRPRLLELGIRHIRERMYYNSTVVARTKDLAANGIKLTGGCWPESSMTNASNCITLANAYGPQTIDAIDGWNEVDNTGSGWATNWVTWQTALYRAMKGNATWASTPVLGNSLASPNSTDAIGYRAAILDLGNLHAYPGGDKVPSGSVGSWTTQWNKIDGGKPDYVTETGYNTCPSCTNGMGVSFKAQGKYAGRLWFEYWNKGVQRTSWYDLIDQGVSTTTRETNWGLLKYDGTPKPSFTVTKNIIALLRDPGASFTPGRLDYTLANSTTAVHSTLLQKRDGRYYLALWQEVFSWNNKTKSDVTNASRAVTLTLPRSASFRVYQPSLGMTPVKQASGTSLTIQVPDEIVIVEIGS
jgi:hypothetical protein